MIDSSSCAAFLDSQSIVATRGHYTSSGSKFLCSLKSAPSVHEKFSHSQNEDCDGLGHVESLLGYSQVSLCFRPHYFRVGSLGILSQIAPTGEAARQLYLCQFANKSPYYYSVDTPCQPGDTVVANLGYVH